MRECTKLPTVTVKTMCRSLNALIVDLVLAHCIHVLALVV